MNYNFLIENNEKILTDYIVELSKNKLPVLIFLYKDENDKIFLIYKLFKFNDNLNAVVLCCKNELFEIIRLEKIIKRNFNNSHIFFIHSCSCNKENYGNIKVEQNPIYSCFNKIITGVGNTTISIFNTCAYITKSYITKSQNIQIMNSIYNIISKAFAII